MVLYRTSQYPLLAYSEAVNECKVITRPHGSMLKPCDVCSERNQFDMELRMCINNSDYT